jgi:hypothetical protein
MQRRRNGSSVTEPAREGDSDAYSRAASVVSSSTGPSVPLDRAGHCVRQLEAMWIAALTAFRNEAVSKGDDGFAPGF